MKIRKQTSIYNFYTYLSSTSTNILDNELKKVNIFADFLSNFDIAFRTSIILHNLFLVDKVLNAYYVKLLAPPTIIHPLYSKKNKNGTVH